MREITICYPRPELQRENCWGIHFSITDPKSHWKQIYTWCWETFGHPATDPDTGEYGGWNYHGGWIYFYKEEYATMYTLRWL